MQEVTSTTGNPESDYALSMNSKKEELIDIPISQKTAHALIGLFNYFDIYAPKMAIVYKIITIFRFLQLIGGSLMAAKPIVFLPGTLVSQTVSIVSVLFHLLPVQYRIGNEKIILLALNVLMVLFGFYLVISAFHYKKTSMVSKLTVNVLSIFIAAGPYLILPIMAQYAGQHISRLLADHSLVKLTDIVNLVVALLVTLFYIWVVVKTYTTTIIFRASSFQTLEGGPQNRIFVTTILITFCCALTTHIGNIPSTVLSVCVFLLYAFDISTVFNCGTFLHNSHQILILTGSILGIIIGAANIYPCFILDFYYGDWYFLAFAIATIVAYVSSYLLINLRIKSDMKLLDEVEASQDISIVKSKGKLKQLIITGFNYCHSCCMDFSIFKMAVENWRDEADVWAAYAKFIAIYPESSSTLQFIIKNVSLIKKDEDLVKLIQNNVTNIINTRETHFTMSLKSKMNKIGKQFTKAKNRVRNIWDLILQGSTSDMDPPIKLAYSSVKECETEVLYLKMLYPNNRFALKQYARYIFEVKADAIEYKKTIEDVAKLQRGLRICNDTVHDLGIEALPHLPEVLTDFTDQLSKTSIDNENILNDLEEQDDVAEEQYETIARLIERHKVPAISYIYWTTIVCYIFLFLIPIIGAMVVFPFFKEALAEPLTFMQGISYTRSIVNIIPCFATRAIFEELDDPKNPGNFIIGGLTMVDGFPATAYGGDYSTRKIIEYFARLIGRCTSLVSPLRSYKSGNKFIEEVRNLVFTGIHDYHQFVSKDEKITSKSSAIQIALFLGSGVGRLLQHKRLTIDVAKGPDSLTVRNNNVIATEAFSKALSVLVDYIVDEYNHFTKIFWIAFIAFSAVNFIIFAIIYFVQTRQLAQNKKAIIDAISELPKTVISMISQSFSNVKNHDNTVSTTTITLSGRDVEYNRQEESIIKLFSSITDSLSSSSSYFLMFCFISIIGLSIGCFWMCIKSYFSASDVVFYNCHHINYLYGCSTFLFSMAQRLYDITMAKYDPSLIDTTLSIETEISEIEEYATLEVKYYHNVRLGGQGTKEAPFEGMSESLSEATQIIRCDNPLALPVEVPESTRCFSAVGQLLIAVDYFKRFASLMRQGIFPKPWGEHVNDAFQIGPLELYEAFFSHAGSQLVPYMRDSLDEEGKKLIEYAAIFAIFVTLFVIIILAIVHQEDVYIKFMISQLMRVPPHELMANKRIMELLAGNYEVKDNEISTGKFVQFANEVVNKLNDIFIICQAETGKVIQVNSAFLNTFGMSEEEILNTNIKEFFVQERFQSEQRLERVYLKPTNMVYVNSIGEKVFLEFAMTEVSGKRIFSGKNQTQNIMHEKLMEDEKRKSDKMLSSILPASLVPRVQAGEKNISFAVQSVTVLFLDVVEFTPWCGSHDAHYVMRMLNIIFKEFDAVTNAHKTMTKIKCIGDCYMAAGGIFDEVNQPAVHAKEVVDFGCIVINKLLEINQAENEKLRIRVGVNTGGPIVAGVIGTEKPTFEILGPAINIAHEMEHHGVPMKVHISRPVYELIYGQSFVIKERGEIDVKGGKMFTYLVDPH